MLKQSIIIIYLLFIPIITLYPQQISEMRVTGKSNFLPNEFIDKAIVDANGEICAGLMILSDLEGLTYSSNNGVVKVNKNPGKDLLFLSADEREVEVYKSGYKPLKIILNEFGIKLEKGKVWKLEVTGDKKLNLIPITVAVTPLESKIYIDDVFKGIDKTYEVSAGIHKLRIEKEGYKTYIEQIDVSTKNVFFSYKLNEIDLVPVQIKSNPAGAKIFINEVDKGETDKGLFLYPGKYTIKLIKTGFSNVSEEIMVQTDSANSFSFDLKKVSGFVNLNITPTDARVLINKEDYSGRNNIEIAPGKYKIEISKDGYKEASDFFEVNLGETISKTYSLEAKYGKFQFSVSPLNAKVKLIKNGDTKYNWQGMTVLKDVPVGEYEIECYANGFKTLRKYIKIEENITTEEDIKLNPYSDSKEEINTFTRKTNSYNDEQKNDNYNGSESNRYRFSIGIGVINSHSKYMGSSNNTSTSEGTGVGIQLDLPLGSNAGIFTTLQFSDSRTVFLEEYSQGTAYDNSDNSEIPYDIRTTKSISLTNLIIEPLLKFTGNSGFYFVIGPSISVNSKNSCRIFLEETLPYGYTWISNDLQTRVSQEEKSLDSLKTMYEIKGGIGWDIILGESICLAPQASLSYSLNSMHDYIKDKFFSYQFSLGLRLRL